MIIKLYIACIVCFLLSIIFAPEFFIFIIIIFGGGFMFFFSMVIICQYDSHFKNLSIIRKWGAVSGVYEKQLKELKETLNSLKINHESEKYLLSNNDTPYRSLIEACTEVQQALANEESKIFKAIAEIEERKCGYWGFIVTQYGEK